MPTWADARAAVRGAACLTIEDGKITCALYVRDVASLLCA